MKHLTCLNTFGHHVSRSYGAARPRQASAQSADPVGASGLDECLRVASPGTYVMAGGICSAPQEEFTRDIRHTPHIVIAIGDDLRTFRAFITGAPARLDAPSTITLYESTPGDFTRFAMSPDDLAPMRSGGLVRLVLVAAAEEKWQHARYAEEGHHLVPPDHVMVSARTLQLWLWQRLTAPCIGDPDMARAS